MAPQGSFEESCEAFASAAQWFLDTAASVGERWEDPALDEWDVRALVGHTSRSFLTIETYLGRPATSVDLASTADYYRATRDVATGAAVTDRGREAGVALGDDPVATLGSIAARVLTLVKRQDGTELLSTIAGGMRLSDYLPTRTFELTVHTADLATALGHPLDVPAAPARQALQIVTDLAVDDGLAGLLLLTATGRPAHPGGFSVLSGG